MSMWRNVARVSGGAAIGQGLVVASTPILTRLYTPEAFGSFGLYFAFASVAIVFVGLRYDLAIASAVDDDQSDRLLAVALAAALPTGAVATLLLWALVRNEWLGFGQLPVGSVPIIGVLIVASSFAMSLRYWNVRRFRFTEVGTATAVQGAGRAAVPIGVAALDPGWWGLLAGDAAGRLLGIMRLARGVPARLRAVMRQDAVAAARSNWRYPAVVMPSSLIDAMSAALPLPLISAMYGVGAAGQFVLVQRMAAVPASLVAASFAEVIHAEGSKRRGADDGALRELAGSSGRPRLRAGPAARTLGVSVALR